MVGPLPHADPPHAHASALSPSISHCYSLRPTPLSHTFILLFPSALSLYHNSCACRMLDPPITGSTGNNALAFGNISILDVSHTPGRCLSFSSLSLSALVMLVTHLSPSLSDTNTLTHHIRIHQTGTTPSGCCRTQQSFGLSHLHIERAENNTSPHMME